MGGPQQTLQEGVAPLLALVSMLNAPIDTQFRERDVRPVCRRKQAVLDLAVAVEAKETYAVEVRGLS